MAFSLKKNGTSIKRNILPDITCNSKSIFILLSAVFLYHVLFLNQIILCAPPKRWSEHMLYHEKDINYIRYVLQQFIDDACGDAKTKRAILDRHIPQRF